MTNRPFLLGTLALSALLILGCSGMNKKTSHKKKSRNHADLKVMESNLPTKRTKKPNSTAQSKKHKKHEYVLKLRPGAALPKFLKGKVTSSDSSMTSTFSKLGMTDATSVHGTPPKNKALSNALGLDRTVHFRSKRPQDEVIRRLTAHPNIEWVEPVVEVNSAGITPNDPYYEYQWHMHQLQITKAWETTMGQGAVVAVIDTGVTEGDDGFYKLLPGKDFVEDDNKPDDMNGHGTHVAGTIAQQANNGIGVVGVAPKASILPIRVLDANGSGNNTWVANGIVWAVDHGANVINLSLGGPMPSEVIADACQYAYEQGVTVVAATGNDGFTDFVGFPAAYEPPIAVGSVASDKSVAFYSNQGREIDLVAPGGDVTADLDGDGLGDGVVQQTIQNGTWDYSFFQGTSMATPHAAGVAALLYANGVTHPDDIKNAMVKTSDDLGKKGWDSVYGNGLVNPVKALAFKGSPPSVASAKAGLTILDTRKRALSDGRVAIGWKTNAAASTVVRGTDGTKVSKATKIRLHKVTVSGKKGEKVTYTVGSMLDGKKATKKITVTF
ncbi:MAG: S8 family serine peptidase [Rhodobacterales bacterium]|nr:S8 family serine peptidase [Rhodobacterales bacterium]